MPPDPREPEEQLTCPDYGHEWLPDYSVGDTCHCGAWYFIPGPNGEPRIEEAPEPDAE